MNLESLASTHPTLVAGRHALICRDVFQPAVGISAVVENLDADEDIACTDYTSAQASAKKGKSCFAGTYVEDPAPDFIHGQCLGINLAGKC